MSEVKQISLAKVDLSKPLRPETLNGVYALFDNGPTLVTEVYRDGEAVDLSDCEAYAYLTDASGQTQKRTCTIEGNTITVFLNTYFLDVAGRFTVSVQLAKANVRQTVRLVRGWVYGHVAEDYWQTAAFTGASQTGANEVTLTFAPNILDTIVLWEVFEVVDGEYVKRETAYASYADGKYTWSATLYDVEAGTHVYCLRGTRENVVGEYSQTVTVWVDENWTA